MASCGFIDTFTWLQNLHPISQWKSNSISMCICSSNSSQNPSLNFLITKNSKVLSFSIVANFNIPVPLWTSKQLKINSSSSSSSNPSSLDQETLSSLMISFIETVLNYGPNKNYFSPKIPNPNIVSNFQDIFNFAFLSLCLLVCIYEAPANLRVNCLTILKNQLVTCRTRQGSKTLMILLGSNLEEQWMRSINLAITNWIYEVYDQNHRALTLKNSSPLFSYAFSTVGLWKVQLYCPVIAMDMESSSNVSADEKLMFSLNYHQIECVIQFNYKVVVEERWANVVVNIDNIRCDVVKLLKETLLYERGAGPEEKYFPSGISLQLTPTLQTNILSISVSKSSENPAREIGIDKTIEASIDPPNSFFGLRLAAGESTTISMKPWKFEQSVYGYTARLYWSLHDISQDGKEVLSSKPSKVSLLKPKAWFKDRYASAYRPFNRQGGVVFAGDEYGERVIWKVDKSMVGKNMEWEIRGWIWLTYWPNKYRTFYNETRRVEFREILNLKIA